MTALQIIERLEAEGHLTITAIYECEWTSADECAMARERSVAGTALEIAPCPVHGDVEAEAC